MKVKFVARITQTLLLCSFLLCGAWTTQAQTDGIFAEFNTSMGSYTCRLEYAKAPKASANFIGLATGEQAWLDLTTGQVKTEPFYEGQIFHRVIAGFMNQGGSPNGEGTDGPGYSFVDEFEPTLRHNSFGILSSANSGPDSNGSQFFVTVGPTAWLNDLHTIFGELTGGSNVVYAINHVATDGNDKPLTNVVLQSVVIRRVGAAAEAFDISAQGLPEVRGLHATIAPSGGGISVSFTNQLNVDNRLFFSVDLLTWQQNQLGIETEAPVESTIYGPTSNPRLFFKMAQVDYGTTMFPPKNVRGKELTIDITDSSTNGISGTLIISFDLFGGGTYTNETSGSLTNTGTLYSYSWTQEPYNGNFYPISFNAPLDADMAMYLNFDALGAGTMSGTVYTASDPPYAIEGTFTLP